jgi:hypothetical protein
MSFEGYREQLIGSREIDYPMQRKKPAAAATY